MRLNRGTLALLLTLLIWGSTYAISKTVLRAVGPLTLTGLRFLIAFVVMAPIAARQGLRPRQFLRPQFVLFGLTGVALFYGLQNVGLEFTSVSSTVLIQSIIPVITVVLAVLFLRERLSRRQIVGALLVTIGIVLVGLASAGDASSSNPLLGNILVFGSALAWAIYTIQGRRLAGAYPVTVMSAASIAAGLVFLCPLVAWELSTGASFHPGLVDVLGIVYLGVVASGLATFLWNYALQYLPASVASPYINLVPVIGLMGALLIGEKIPLIQIAGGCLAILGVWLSHSAA